MQDPTPEQIEAFRAAWHEADAEGDAGNRVRRGLAAALSAHQPVWLAHAEVATSNATMWMDEAIAQRHRADDLERSLADIRSTLEASNDAMVEAITEERDALDDRLAKVDVELSETLVRAERAESLAEVAKATAHTHLETLVSMVAKRDTAPAAPAARLRAFATECVEHGDMTPAAARMLNRILDGE